MDDKVSPKATGISDLTGKVVRVRHANEADMVFIKEAMKKYQSDVEELNYNDFIVAAEDSKIVGFGNLKKTGGINEIGCIIVIEDKRGQGIGQLIAKHLVEDASVDRIYVATDLAAYLKKLGFTKLKENSKEYLETVELVCMEDFKTKKILMSRAKRSA